MMTKKRILMIITELGYGGAEQSFIRLANYLSKEFSIQIAVFNKQYNNDSYIKTKIDTDLPITIIDKGNNNKLKNWINRYQTIKKLKKNSDLTISFLTGPNLLNVLTKKHCKTLISMRGSRQYDPFLKSIKRFIFVHIIDPFSYKFSDSIVSVSDGLSSELKSYVSFKTQKKIHTIEVFVDSNKLIKQSDDPIEEGLLNLRNIPVIITVGRLSIEKGFQYLIPVFARIINSIKNAKLILIGDGPLLNELHKICEEQNLKYTHDIDKIKSCNVLFLGYKERPNRYFKCASVFALSSLTEGFPNGVIEALASGIHVVATDCPWGARSVLSKDRIEKHFPYQSKVKENVEFGTLLPRIDFKSNHPLWAETLTTALSDDYIDPISTSEKQNRVRELDLKIIGLKWKSEIYKLLK